MQERAAVVVVVAVATRLVCASCHASLILPAAAGFPDGSVAPRGAHRVSRRVVRTAPDCYSLFITVSFTVKYENLKAQYTLYSCSTDLSSCSTVVGSANPFSLHI